MRSITVILCCLLMNVSLFAQKAPAPGYVGKKLLVGYHFNTFPALLAPLANSSSDDSYGDFGVFKFHVKHEANLEYVLGRHFSLGTSYRFQRSFAPLKGEGVQLGNQQAVRFKDNEKIVAQHFTLNFNFYNLKSIAPVGKHSSVQFGYVAFKLDPDQQPIQTEQNYAPYSTYPLTLTENSFRTFVISYAYQRRSIIVGNLYILTGLQANLLFGGDDFEEGNYSFDMTNFIPGYSYNFLRRQNYFDFKIGLGLILL